MDVFRKKIQNKELQIPRSVINRESVLSTLNALTDRMQKDPSPFLLSLLISRKGNVVMLSPNVTSFLTTLATISQSALSSRINQ